MSGIAGVFHLNGAPVDRVWLDKMSGCLALRGPDGGRVWSEGGAGLCHTLLRISPERSECDSKPCTIDGQVWIAADARIDDRETLLAKLQPHARQDLGAAGSAQLILHAYAHWGVDCVEHLLGDFAFILWDAPCRRVFCARDHLGVKPLYYAQDGRCLMVSNTLDCLRELGVVPTDPNDQAVADFLLFGMNLEADTTFFSAIRRLPAAHRLLASPELLRVEKFWDLPVDEPLYLRSGSEYIERFRELMRTVVRDRLPGGTLGISMSGGIDSPSLAATAIEVGAAPVAFTTVYDSTDPDQIYAGSVAKYLGIPIHVRDLHDEPHGWPPVDPPLRTNEPSPYVLRLGSQWQWPNDLSTWPRVVLYGEGPDNALTFEWRAYLTYLHRHRRWGRMARDVVTHMAAHRRIPLLPTLPRIWRARRNPIPSMVFPDWLNTELISHFELRKRWEDFHLGAPPLHPVRPVSYQAFRDLSWAALFEGLDVTAGRMRFEFRYPFIDLRLLRFLLAVPAIPWCRCKYLLRRALRGRLPEEVLRRPKTPVRGSLGAELGRGFELPRWPIPAALSHYVHSSMLSMDSTNKGWVEYDANMRAIGLHYWLIGL